MRKIFISSILALSCVSAFAWGPREQGALAGLAAGVILSQPQTYVAPAPVYVQPPVVPMYPQPMYVQPAPYSHPPMTCYDYPSYDSYGRVVGVQRVCNYR